MGSHLCKNKEDEALLVKFPPKPYEWLPRIAVKNTPRLSLNLRRVVLVKDLFLSIHHGSVPMICSASEASRGEVPVSGK